LKTKGISLNLVLASIYLIVFFAFTAGLINALIEGQNFKINGFIPSRAVQNDYETVIGIFTLIFGFSGALIMYKAYNAVKRNEKYGLLSIGLIIFSISVVAMYRIIEAKS
jgi:asparagine N-glycosylation enzyme membrane subunit Stt3